MKRFKHLRNPLTVVSLFVLLVYFIDQSLRLIEPSYGFLPREGIGRYIVLSIAILLGVLNLGFLFYHMGKAMHEVRKA